MQGKGEGKRGNMGGGKMVVWERRITRMENIGRGPFTCFYLNFMFLYRYLYIIGSVYFLYFVYLLYIIY